MFLEIDVQQFEQYPVTATEEGEVSGRHGLKVEPPSDRRKYVELKCLEAHSKGVKG